MNRENVKAVFVDKVLGVRNYASDKAEFFVSDFLDESILDCFLDEVDTGESDISPAGKSFLKHYFGFENLAGGLLKRNKFFLSAKSDQGRLSEVKFWLENLEPMETIKFVEKSRGDTKENVRLREDLLPPENFS